MKLPASCLNLQSMTRNCITNAEFAVMLNILIIILQKNNNDFMPPSNTTSGCLYFVEFSLAFFLGGGCFFSSVIIERMFTFCISFTYLSSPSSRIVSLLCPIVSQWQLQKAISIFSFTKTADSFSTHKWGLEAESWINLCWTGGGVVW